MPFEINIHVFLHQDTSKTDTKLDQVLALLGNIQERETNMTAQLDALTAQVTANTTLEQSAITLIQGLAAQFAAVKDDPAAIAALSDKLKTSADALFAALTANTPVAP